MDTLYHPENPMLAEWRRRDMLRLLRETYDAAGVTKLCSDILAMDAEGPVHPQDAALLISKFGKAGDVSSAEAVHARGRQQGTTPPEELRVKSALMHTYIRAGLFEKARDVFNVVDSNVAFRLDSVVAVAGATTAAALGDEDLFRRAANALRMDPFAAPLPPIEFEVARVKLAGLSGGPTGAEAALDQALSAYRALGQKATSADACLVFQEVVDAYAAAGDHRDVLRMTERMIAASQRPTEKAVMQCIVAWERLGPEVDAIQEEEKAAAAAAKAAAPPAAAGADADDDGDDDDDADDLPTQFDRIFQRFRAGPRISTEVCVELLLR